MKTRIPPFGRMLITMIAPLLGALLAAHGAGRTNSAVALGSAVATNAAPVEAQIPQSVFELPTPSKQLKDPFFPRSTRIVFTAPVLVSTKVPPIVPVDLKINGTSGSEDRPLVIINNVTFAVGDNREVTSGGRRVSLQCLEIDLSAGKATVEVSGNRRVLFFQKIGK